VAAVITAVVAVAAVGAAVVKEEVEAGSPLLTQNQHLVPSTQQANKAGLTRAGSEACQSIFLKLTKGEKQLDKTWNLPGGTRQFRIYG
jgi:hypothetical protein